MTFNFKHLEVEDKTSWMDLPEIGPGARVCLAPASEANRPYFNALLKRAGRMKPKQRLQVTAQDLEETRQSERELFAEHVVRNWEAIPGPKGPVAYSPDLRREFLDCLPDWLFDRVRLHAADVANYIEAPLPDVEDLAKNSVSGSTSS